MVPVSPFIDTSCAHLLRKMVERAWEWAKAQSAEKNKKIRNNAVHGEEEIRIVLNDNFMMEETNLEETTQPGNIDVEERFCI